MTTIPFWFKILICCTICLLVGFVSGFATSSAIDGWYSTLNKPFFNPPNWVFAPVWGLLYILMGISVALIWNAKLYWPFKRNLFVLFALQLLLNFLWSILFFGIRRPIFALIEIIVLWLAIYLCIRKFRPISKLASQLLIPYLLWVSFATLLNATIVFLN